MLAYIVHIYTTAQHNVNCHLKIPVCLTRKLSYRKDDRAMRHMGALKILESL